MPFFLSPNLLRRASLARACFASEHTQPTEKLKWIDGADLKPTNVFTVAQKQKIWKGLPFQ